MLSLGEKTHVANEKASQVVARRANFPSERIRPMSDVEKYILKKKLLNIQGCLPTSACLTSLTLDFIMMFFSFLFGGLPVEPIPYASLCLIFLFINTLLSQEHKSYLNKQVIPIFI